MAILVIIYSYDLAAAALAEGSVLVRRKARLWRLTKKGIKRLLSVYLFLSATKRNQKENNRESIRQNSKARPCVYKKTKKIKKK